MTLHGSLERGVCNPQDHLSSYSDQIPKEASQGRVHHLGSQFEGMQFIVVPEA